MNLKRLSLLLLVLAFGCPEAKAQNKILLLNGKIIETELYSLGDEYLTFRKGNKKSLSSIDRYDVFSVTDSTGNETLVYTPIDSLDFTVEEARHYILGEQIGTSVYKAPATAWTSAAIGAGSSILAFYALPIPMVYALVLGRFSPEIKNVPSTIDPAIVSSEAFRYGYQKSARNLKIQRSLKWGYIGLGVGFTALLIYGINE